MDVWAGCPLVCVRPLRVREGARDGKGRAVDPILGVGAMEHISRHLPV